MRTTDGRLWHMAWAALMGVVMMLALMLAGGCTSVRYVPVERDSVRTEVKYLTDLVHDSVHVETETRHDTVWKTEQRWHVRYVDRHDTVYVNVKSEEPKAEVKVKEKTAPTWLTTLLHVLGAATVLLVVWFIGSVVFSIRRKMNGRG